METGLRIVCAEEKRWGGKLLLVILFLAVLSATIPDARNGMLELCNRIFAQSEALNRYAYDRFPVPEAQTVHLALGLLLCMLAAWTGFLVIHRSRGCMLLTALALAGVQIYFGLALPGALNVLIYGSLAAGLMRTRNAGSIAWLVGAVLLVSILVLGAWPQTDERLEAVSEQVRDFLSPGIETGGGSKGEAMDDVMATRHVNTQSLETGDGAAEGQTYRLITVEQEQISMPKWIDYARVALLLLLVALLLVGPFLPFIWLNQRRKRVGTLREGFSSADPAEAIRAYFRYTIRYLDRTGLGSGNVLFREWDRTLRIHMPEEYVRRFQDGYRIFEEAQYSDHEMTAQQVVAVRELLHETEERLFDQADWKQRFRLRYVECLHE